MSEAAFPDRVREFFTLRDAERDARALPAAARAETRHALALAFQKREAAETLWPRGCASEALKLAKAALDEASSALASFADGASEGEAREGLAKPSWLERARTIADDARKRTASAKLPELEADAQASDEETFRVMIAALLEIEETLGLGLAEPRELSTARRKRATKTTALVVFVVAALAWWFHTPLDLHATASAQYPGNYAAENAVDGDTKTAWLLPDKQLGWLDVTVGKARQVSALRFVPGNPPVNDRAVKDAHIEAFLADKLVKSTDATFREPVGAAPDWTEVTLGAKCDRIRINVRSFHKNAAAIAEVQIK